MKIRHLFWATMLGGVSVFCGMAHAQDASPDGTQTQAQNGGRGVQMGFLSAEDRRHLMRVRREVLAANPDLKAEGESLMKEREFVKNKGASATAEDKQTLRNNLLAHGEKMEAAMVKDDPTVEPILDEVKQHMQQRFGQGDQAGTQGTDDSSN